MDIITGHIDLLVLSIALAVFIARGLYLPWTDKGSFVQAAVRHNPKVQCIALAAVGYGLVGIINGTVADWIATGRAWLIDAMTNGADWALGAVGALAVAVAAALIWFDYVVPGGLEPDQGKPMGHMVMWLNSLLLYPMLVLVLGSISLVSFLVIFAVMWFINVKFRGRKRAPAAAAATR
jgi:hypothetical protein